MSGDRPPKTAIERMIPLLLGVESNLDQDASLESLARDFGQSTFAFHRSFSAAVGETPRKHVERLRLERAALKLAITDDSVLEIAMAVGFNTHETFSRAFLRRFGRAPRAYRQAAKVAQKERLERNRTFRGEDCVLSDVRFEALPRTYLISIRRLGAYADLDAETREALWRELIDRAGRNGVLKSPVRMGFFPDDPGMTPPAMQRADLCIPVERPIESTDRVRCFRFAGGMHGVIEHVGAYSTAGQAYRNLADGIRASDRYIFRDAPPLQIFRQVHLGGDRSANHSEICFAVKRRSGAREGQETSRTAP